MLLAVFGHIIDINISSNDRVPILRLPIARTCYGVLAAKVCTVKKKTTYEYSRSNRGLKIGNDWL